MPKYYSDHTPLDVLIEVFRTGKSTGWSGDIKDKEYYENKLKPFNVVYTDDFRGTFELGNKFKIFDNGGETADRYTLVTEKGDVYGFSENPSHPQGFGCYSHTISRGEPIGFYKKCVAPYCKETEIHLSDLSNEAQKFVLERI